MGTVIAGGGGTGLEQQNRNSRPGRAQPRMVVCTGIMEDIANIAVMVMAPDRAPAM